MTIDINIEELHILRHALRLYRHTNLVEREEIIELQMDDPRNPDWNNNEEWLTRVITFENDIAALLKKELS